MKKRSTICFLAALILLAGLVSPAPAQDQSRDERRVKRMKFPELVAAMKLQEGHAVADLGAGQGAFTAALSKAVGAGGRVLAIDIDESTIKSLRTKVEKQSLKNVTVIHGDVDDPKLAPDSLDAVLVIDAYH
jgi:ubiquinone/menaquinone biosynthesis C-methylase UbiE